MKPKKPEPDKEPKPGRTLGVRFSGEQIAALEKIAAREYRSVSGIIKVALSEYFRNQGSFDWPEA